MATYTVTNAAEGIPAGAKAHLAQVVLDFSSTALVAGTDVVQAIEVPANTLVVCAGIEVLTAGGASSVLDLGDTTVDRYVTDVDGNTAGSVEIGTASWLYTSADTIDLSADTANFAGKVRVFAVLAPMGSAPTAAAFA
jgi:hypothetical protein